MSGDTGQAHSNVPAGVSHREKQAPMLPASRSTSVDWLRAN